MSRHGRYWIFFVIVAVGLALSWGQVGRMTQRQLATEPVVYLIPEPDCRPRITPCAAVAGDRAIVLGPAVSGLRVRQTGLRDADIVDVEATPIMADGSEVGTQTLKRGADGWVVGRAPAHPGALRIRIVGNRETTIAEFPL